MRDIPCPAAVVANHFRGTNRGKLTEVSYSDSTETQVTKESKCGHCVFFQKNVTIELLCNIKLVPPCSTSL